MAIGNQPESFVLQGCLFSATSNNLYEFSAWCVLAKLSVNLCKYS